MSFRPQCHPLICANNTPIIKATDEGTWRRIRMVPFLSLFTERPVSGDPFHPYQFKVQDRFDEKIEQWKEVFLAMLIEKAMITKGKVQPCEIVVQASKEYRAKQDVISEFAVDMIVPDKMGKITKTEIQQNFSNWYRGAYGHGGPSMTEVHEALDRMFGNYNRPQKAWLGVRLNVEHANKTDEQSLESKGVWGGSRDIFTEKGNEKQESISEKTEEEATVSNENVPEKQIAKKRIIRKKI